MGKLECTCERLGGFHQEGCAWRANVDRIAELEAEVERLKKLNAHEADNIRALETARAKDIARAEQAEADNLKLMRAIAEHEAKLAEVTAERDVLYESASAAHTWLSMLSGASANMPIDRANALHKTIRNLFDALEALPDRARKIAELIDAAMEWRKEDLARSGPGRIKVDIRLGELMAAADALREDDND